MNDYEKRRLVRHLESALRHYTAVMATLGSGEVERDTRMVVQDAIDDVHWLIERLRAPALDSDRG